MFLTRFFGRSLLLTGVRSESTAAAAAASTASSGHNPLEEFFEKDRGAEDQKHVYGILVSDFPIFVIRLFVGIMISMRSL